VIGSLVPNLIPHIVDLLLLLSRIEVEIKFSSKLFPNFDIDRSDFSSVKKGMRDVQIILMFF
jgi:hypothetical protein